MAAVNLILLAAYAFRAEPALAEQAVQGGISPRTGPGRVLAAHARRMGCTDDALALLRRGPELMVALPETAPEVVVTLPPRLRSKLPERLRHTLQATRVAIRDLVESASTSVVLFAPYANVGVAKDLGPWLDRAASQGAQISVALEDDGQFDHRPFFRELRRCIRTSHANQLHLFLVPKSPARISHAKIIVVDGRRAYVGSGNLTDQALARNFEAGAILEGDAARALSEGLRFYLLGAGAEEVSA